MPIRIQKDDKGIYLQWGTHGAKYYFNPNSERSYNTAYSKVLKQAAAIFAHNYRSKKT